MTEILASGFAYLDAGYSVIVISDTKKSLHRWKRYQHHRMSKQRLSFWLAHPHANGIAVICGNISRGLEVIDIDEKNVLDGKLFNQYIIKIDKYSPDLVSRLAIAITKNKGFHLLYTCESPAGSTNLAQRLCTCEELSRNPNQKVKILIESRGVNGYAIVAPTPGYRFLQHDLFTLPYVTMVERKALFAIARTFNSVPENAIKLNHHHIPVAVHFNYENPLDDYDQRGDVFDLLENHGWIRINTIGDKTYFRRPGETDHVTSGDFHHGLNKFGVTSTSTCFKQFKGYKPSAVYAILECAGDFKEAARKLLLLGYGVPYKDRIQNHSIII